MKTLNRYRGTRVHDRGVPRKQESKRVKRKRLYSRTSSFSVLLCALGLTALVPFAMTEERLAAPGLNPSAGECLFPQVASATWKAVNPHVQAVGKVDRVSNNQRPIEGGEVIRLGGESSLAVWVTTDKRSYHRGESIGVTIQNKLATIIYIPLGQAYCSMVSVQRREADQWETEDSCVDGSPTFFIPMAPKSKVTGALDPAPREEIIQGPFVGQSSTPGEMEQDIRTLPPARPWNPGDPIREVPLRDNPSAVESLQFSALDHELAPGTYRIALSFTLDASAAPLQTVYSEEFVVTA
jgi:hypothetical protein